MQAPRESGEHMFIAVKLDLESTNSHRETPKTEAVRGKKEEENHRAQMQEWLDEGYKYGPWNALLIARTDTS
jgi:hypothetical protein